MRVRPLHDLPRRIVTSTRSGRLSTRYVFVDLAASTGRASILLGSGRSGTTKLAELLTSARGMRLLFEPLHTELSRVVPPTFVWGEYVAPDSRRPELIEAWTGYLRGRTREERLDKHNRARVVRHRVVKCIAGTNLAGWLRASFPDVGIVYVVRHPVPVASSSEALASQWSVLEHPHIQRHVDPVGDRELDRLGILTHPSLASREGAVRASCRNTTDSFGCGVVRWCVENALMLKAPVDGVHVVRYEDLFSRPAMQLPAIARHLGIPLAPDVLDTIEDASASDWKARDDRGIEARTRGWMSEVDASRQRRAYAILEEFGLGDAVSWPTAVAP